MMLPRSIFGDEMLNGPIMWVLFAVICIIFLISFTKEKKPLFYHVTFIIFFIYLNKLFGLLFFPIPIDSIGLNSVRTMQQGPYFNIIPFKDILYFVDIAAKQRFELIPAIKNIAGNIIAFMPFGFLFPCLSKSFMKFKKLVLLAFLVPLGVELTQLIGSLAMQAVWRFADIDDVILNMAGMILGFLILNGFLYVVKKRMGVNLLDLINGKTVTV